MDHGAKASVISLSGFALRPDESPVSSTRSLRFRRQRAQTPVGFFGNRLVRIILFHLLVQPDGLLRIRLPQQSRQIQQYYRVRHQDGGLGRQCLPLRSKITDIWYCAIAASSASLPPLTFFSSSSAWLCFCRFS